MVCYSKQSIAFLAQLYFVGFATKIVLVPLPEKFGLVKFVKFFVIPLNILSFILTYMANEYVWRCVGFLLAGIMRIKMMTIVLILKQQTESKFQAYAATCAYGLDSLTLIVFCLYLQVISRNAIAYLHFVNALGVLCMIIFMLTVVECPSHMITKG